MPSLAAAEPRRSQRWDLWAVAGAVAWFQVLGAFRRPFWYRLSDLQVYWDAIRFWANGGGLYNYAAPDGAPFTYPPFAAIVLIPAAIPPKPLIGVLWTAATVVAVVAVARIAVRARSAGRRPAEATLPAVAILLFASAPVSSNIRFGQVSLFLALLVLVDALDVVPRRFRGVLTGIAAAIKLTPALFLAFWLVSGARRRALIGAATFLTATVCAWRILPGESGQYWLAELWDVDRVGRLATAGNQSLNGAMLRWEVADQTRSAVAMAVGLAVIVLAMIRARRAHRGGDPLTATIVVGAAGLVFSPVSWTHHQVWLVLAALLPVSRRPAVQRAWIGGVIAIMATSLPGVLGSLPGGAVTGNARLLLAIGIAVLVPFQATRRRPAGPQPESGLNRVVEGCDGRRIREPV